MHLLTTPLLYRILSFKASPERTRLIGIILTILFTIVMVVHMVMDEFLLHASSFGLAVYLIATRTFRIIPGQVPDLKVRKTLQQISLFGCCECQKIRVMIFHSLLIVTHHSLLWIRLLYLAD